MKYSDIYDLYCVKQNASSAPLTFELFGVVYDIVAIGLFDHTKNLAEILLKSKDLGIQVQLDIPISFQELHEKLSK